MPSSSLMFSSESVSPIRLGLLSFALAMLLAGCAQQQEKHGTMFVGNRLHVRTTAYTGRNNAICGRLSHGPVISAASDWSEFPVGTRFRIRATGQTYEIDDFGSALIGTRTIDLCMPGSSAMHQWGVRWVDIDVLQWGSPSRSLEILAPRQKSWMARRMTVALRRQTSAVPERFHRVKL